MEKNMNKMKILRKGISKDNSFIRLVFSEDYYEDFVIVEKERLFLGYGYCVRTPDFFTTIKGKKYACFWQDGKTIIRSNKCYEVE